MTVAAVVRGTRRTTEAPWWLGRVGLGAILSLYLLLGAVWSLTVPLGEGPDEPGHLRYALFLRENVRLPVQQDDPAHSDVPGEGHQPPLAYLLMQPFMVSIASDTPLPDAYGNPDFRWNGGIEPNAYLHGAAEGVPYHGLLLSWHLVRLGSVLIGLVSILICWATVRQIWPDAPGLALGAAALIAFTPQWIFLHALASNDPLLIALTSLLVYQSVTATQGVPEGRRGLRAAVACGITLGLMLLTKQSGLAFLPLPLLGLLLGRHSLRNWLLQCMVLLGVAAVLAGWWYLRNWRLYGDPFGLQVFQVTFAVGDFRLDSWASWSEGIWNLLRSSWGAFGWLTLPLPDGAYIFAAAGLALALAGLCASAGTQLWSGRIRVLLVLGLSVGLAFVWTVLFAITAGMVAWQGRFLYPVAPAIAVLLVVGFATALPQSAGLWSTVALGLALSAVLPFTLIRPTYATYALRADQVPEPNILHRFDYGWRRGIELRHADFEPIVDGDEMQVTFTWHLVEPVNRSWTIFVHLVDDQDQIVAKDDEIPIGGRSPTDDWVPGDWFVDPHTLSLEDVEPGTYTVRVGFFDPETSERLRVYGGEGMDLLGDSVDLGEVHVVRQK